MISPQKFIAKLMTAEKIDFKFGIFIEKYTP